MILIPEMKTWYGMISTLGTLGRFSKMPGTLGSLAACLIWIAFGGLSLWVIAAVAVIGTIAADKYEKAVEREDPPEVVIDEVAGCWVACWGFEPTYAIVGLFIFRIIDITKPFPVREMERLPGGVGIMADDILGGVIANLLLRGLTWTFFKGGMETIRGLYREMTMDTKFLAERLIEEAASRNMTIALAESCTGGLIAGSSDKCSGSLRGLSWLSCDLQQRSKRSISFELTPALSMSMVR